MAIVAASQKQAMPTANAARQRTFSCGFKVLRAIQRLHDLPRMKWLADELRALDAFSRLTAPRCSRDIDHRNIWIRGAHPPGDLKAVRAWTKVDVGHKDRHHSFQTKFFSAGFSFLNP
jgi:hypothetical protein